MSIPVNIEGMMKSMKYTGKDNKRTLPESLPRTMLTWVDKMITHVVKYLCHVLKLKKEVLASLATFRG